ncbi:MAG TPA: molybdate ABC transporter substrate-binding protein [Fimbriimonadaceae bacterium]|nr:molybdate ABC transporter substrate-binding protein [Fimbriimonadaceae bacterium]
MLAILPYLILAHQTQTLNVFAAASLKESLTAIARSYEASHPGLTIRLNFAGSQTLAAQINHGAPADVFASAAQKNLEQISYDRGSYRIFVFNKLEIAVRKGFGGLDTIRDLPKATNLVIADPAVPVGHYTESFFAKAGRQYGTSWLAAVRSHVVSREADVKAVLAKVKLGEADAGIVYVSDVTTARGQVQEVPIPDRLNELAEYPVAIPSGAAAKEDAKHFIKGLLDAESQRLFARDGFVPVTTPASALTLMTPSGAKAIPLPLSSRYAKRTVKATNERKQTADYTGVAIEALIPVGRTVTFVGADLYKQVFPLADLKQRKAILVRHPDNNYQLIVPGLKPSTWVNWLRRIEVK